MTRNGEIERTHAETLGDFSTNASPSLFIDNWGRDTMDRFGSKLKPSIDAAVALAQLMSSIRSGEPVNPDALDVSSLDGVAFVDGNDEENDHFFSIKLDSMFRGGSYDGPRVGAQFMSGYVRLEPLNGADSTYARYNERWSTYRGEVIPDRDPRLFAEDLSRINNALSALEEVSENDLPTQRPESWPNQPSSLQPSRNTLAGLRVAKVYPVYVGESPLPGVTTEPDRVVRIPFLDD